MPNFMRTYNGRIHLGGEVHRLGFSNIDPRYIPKDYMKAGKFKILRLCMGLGDWGIISAMPRLLKSKYPDSEVLIPSVQSLKAANPTNAWSHWSSPERNHMQVFANNPYVDGFYDIYDYEGEIYNDHYRIYDESPNKPLLRQMLEFWRFTPDELSDIQPELYWTENEYQKADEIIATHFGEKEFGSLFLHNTELGLHTEPVVDAKLKPYLDPKLSWIWYGQAKPDGVNIGLDLTDMKLSPRLQLLIRSRAKLSLGVQTSMGDILARYTDVYQIPVLSGVRENIIDGVRYL